MQEREPNRYSRREALGFGIGAVALITVGCSSEESDQVEPTSTEESIAPIRREAGIFTDQDIEDLANSMLSETEYNEVAYAGSILLKNVKGEPSFSTMTELFSDSIVEIKVTDEPYPIAQTTVSIENGRLKMDEIGFNREKIEDASEFLLKFISAKELLTPLAFENTAKFVMYNFGENATDNPEIDNPKKIDAMTLYTPSGMPVSFLADIVGHALMVPDYLAAADNNEFTEDELNGDVLRIFNLVSNVCIAEEILEEVEGKYAWTGEYVKTHLVWTNLAEAIYSTRDQSLELDEEVFRMAYDGIKTDGTNVQFSLL